MNETTYTFVKGTIIDLVESALECDVTPQEVAEILERIAREFREE